MNDFGRKDLEAIFESAKREFAQKLEAALNHHYEKYGEQTEYSLIEDFAKKHLQALKVSLPYFREETLIILARYGRYHISQMVLDFLRPRIIGMKFRERLELAKKYKYNGVIRILCEIPGLSFREMGEIARISGDHHEILHGLI